MALPHADRESALEAIAEHLISSGGNPWQSVMSRFPSVPAPTFWRWVREVRTRPNAKALDAARTLLSGVPGASVEAKAVLPAPVPASALVEGGIGAVKKMNFLREFDVLMGDARLLREFSMCQRTGGVRIPRTFVDSARLRIQLMQMWLEALPVLYSAEQTQKLFSAVIDAVGECDPEMQKRILAALREIRERTGFVSVDEKG